LAPRWKILYQQRDQQKSEREKEQEAESAMMVKDADCRLPLKAGQAVGARGILFSIVTTSTYLLGRRVLYRG